MNPRPLLLLALLGLLAPLLPAADETFTRQEDVIYGRKFGTALTMDVFKPKEHGNGIGIVQVISGGWFSSHDNIGPHPGFLALVERGYTVFAVVHGSQPKFTIPEAVADMNRAVRFIRFHAKDEGIDPDRIGVTGGSAGGHLSLMLGTGTSDGDANAKDPVDRVSSRIQCVGCFFPPTDFLNYGQPGEIALGRGTLTDFAAPFDFHEFDPKAKRFVKVEDEAKVLALGRSISPIYHITAQSAPSLIIHGDKDKLVPMQQAETFLAKLKEAGVDGKLVVKAGAQHGWANMGVEVQLIGDWFDAHLKQPAVAPGSKDPVKDAAAAPVKEAAKP